MVIQKVFIIGSGLIGAGIAQACAQSEIRSFLQMSAGRSWTEDRPSRV
jgi:3-hydroxyacyl-CoA dehydrogenase